MKKLGDKGIYALCDITNLPFKDNSMDGIVSLHTIYHVPANEQYKAFYEVHRVLKHGATAVVVYSWGNHSILMKIVLFPLNLIRFFAKVIRMFTPKQNKSYASSEPKLCFYPHNYKWFDKEVRRLFNCDIASWRSVSVSFLKAYAHNWLLGKQLLSFIYLLEDKFPRFLGIFGQYPMFILKKQER